MWFVLSTFAERIVQVCACAYNILSLLAFFPFEMYAVATLAPFLLSAKDENMLPLSYKK